MTLHALDKVQILEGELATERELVDGGFEQLSCELGRKTS